MRAECVCAQKGTNTVYTIFDFLRPRMLSINPKKMTKQPLHKQIFLRIILIKMMVSSKTMEV